MMTDERSDGDSGLLMRCSKCECEYWHSMSGFDTLCDECEEADFRENEDRKEKEAAQPGVHVGIYENREGQFGWFLHSPECGETGPFAFNSVHGGFAKEQCNFPSVEEGRANCLGVLEALVRCLMRGVEVPDLRMRLENNVEFRTT